MKARAVIAGLTRVNPIGYGGWTGACPGCDRDLVTMSEWLVRGSTFERLTLLRDHRATWAAFSSAIMVEASGLESGDLLLIGRSGHGGRCTDDNGDELDGYDETLCMFDRQVRDDEMWALLCAAVPAGVRVVLITDACHSETSFRGLPLTPGENDAPLFQGHLLALSGCADDMLSWGDATGGRFTSALNRRRSPGLSYQGWFVAARDDMGPGQVPRLVEVGESFASREALT